LHTIDTTEDKPHLVCLHGYGSTSLVYLAMMEHLQPHFHVHALDIFGMGLSSRGDWKEGMTEEETMNYYVDAIEEWRK
jgi:pimeloyl-ACP methyl ester carboxylesterase